MIFFWTYETSSDSKKVEIWAFCAGVGEFMGLSFAPRSSRALIKTPRPTLTTGASDNTKKIISSVTVFQTSAKTDYRRNLSSEDLSDRRLLPVQQP
jgi:hypothetical protein